MVSSFSPTCSISSIFAVPLLLGLAGGLATGCAMDDGDGSGNESEVITTVRLTFTPPGGGSSVVAAFTDPDGDGGMSGSSDPIMLVRGTTYDLELELLDELQDPAVDITPEVAQEAEVHQVFITGTAVDGPATQGDGTASLLLHAYADLESNYGDNAVGDDLPVGLANTITALSAGTDMLMITLRHMPERNGQPQKTADLATRLAAGEPLPGQADVAVGFEVTVQ